MLMIVLSLCEFILYMYTGSISSLSLVLTSLWGTACLLSIAGNFSGGNPTLASNLRRLDQTPGEPLTNQSCEGIRCSEIWLQCALHLCSLSFRQPTAPVLYGEVVEQRPPAYWFSARNKSCHKQLLHVWQYDMSVHMSFFFPMIRGSAKGWHAQDNSTKCSLLIQPSSIPSMQLLSYRSCMLTWRSIADRNTWLQSAPSFHGIERLLFTVDPVSLKQIIETRPVQSSANQVTSPQSPQRLAVCKDPSHLPSFTSLPKTAFQTESCTLATIVRGSDTCQKACEQLRLAPLLRRNLHDSSAVWGVHFAWSASKMLFREDLGNCHFWNRRKQNIISHTEGSAGWESWGQVAGVALLASVHIYKLALQWFWINVNALAKLKRSWSFCLVCSPQGSLNFLQPVIQAPVPATNLQNEPFKGGLWGQNSDKMPADCLVWSENRQQICTREHILKMSSSCHLGLGVGAFRPAAAWLSQRLSEVHYTYYSDLHILYISICLSVYLSVCLSVCRLVGRSVDWQIDLSIYLSIHPSIHPSFICLSVCLSI